MGYTDARVSSAVAAMRSTEGGDAGEVGAALAVAGLSAERRQSDAGTRRHDPGCASRRRSLRQLAEVAGLDRKTVTAIVGAGSAASGPDYHLPPKC